MALALRRNQPDALRALGPLTRLDLRLLTARTIRYREARRLAIAPIIGEDLAAQTIGMVIAYTTWYYVTVLAAVLTGWGELVAGMLPWVFAGPAWSLSLGLLIRRHVWMHRVTRDARVVLSQRYGRPIRSHQPALNVPAIRRVLRVNGVPESEWPPLPAATMS